MRLHLIEPAPRDPTTQAQTQLEDACQMFTQRALMAADAIPPALHHGVLDDLHLLQARLIASARAALDAERAIDEIRKQRAGSGCPKSRTVLDGPMRWPGAA